MKVVSWNIENALPRLAALPAVVEELGAPDVLCLQELRIRRNDADAVSALQAALPLVSADIVPRVRSAEILPLLPWSDHAPERVEL